MLIALLALVGVVWTKPVPVPQRDRQCDPYARLVQQPAISDDARPEWSSENGPAGSALAGSRSRSWKKRVR